MPKFGGYLVSFAQALRIGVRDGQLTIHFFEGAIPCAKSVYPLSFRSSHCRPLRDFRYALGRAGTALVPALCVCPARHHKKD